MKTLVKILMVQLCCFPLLITDAMARDGGDRKGGSGGKSRQANRPSSRPASSPKRNPITQSKPSRPAARPADRPTAKPATRPTSRPQTADQRPANKPNVSNRPETKPAKPNNPNRPDTKPAERPNIPDRPGDNKPNRPDKKPNRPDKKPNRPESRPETLPGHVKYPKPGKPTTLPGNVNRPPDKRPGGNHQKPEKLPGKNTRPIKKPNFDRHDKTTNITNVNIDKSKTVNNTRITNKKNDNWWDSGDKRPGYRNKSGNNYYRGGDTNIKINNNFKNNANWSTNRKNWGYNPWWNRPATRPWYGGSWNCGWNNSYHHHHSYYRSYRPMVGYGYYDDDNDVAEAIGWGLVGWNLGKLIFDTGYQTYSNPYPAQPVPSAQGGQVTYTQPITVVAAETAPADDDAGKMTEDSESSVAESQEAFKQANYLLALEAANKAVGEAPGDGALHEYRALVLFALGKYSEAAGVLNPVLAGGPGWDWTTLISLYQSQETYLSQLQALENYCKAKPDAADARFLLGYHYMVCGFLDKATVEFAAAARLQPADSVSAQLRDLTAASSNNGAEDKSLDPEAPANQTPPPTPVPLEQLTGTWVADKGAQGTISLAFKDDGKFVWTYRNGEKTNAFEGEFSMNHDGLLVLDAEESQMVASVALPQDGGLKFVLVGGPPGDPGLDFKKG